MGASGAANPPCASDMSIRANEDLDPNEGPSFTEFAVLASLFAIILLLIPVGVFTFSWPIWLLGLLLFIDLGLLFLVSMSAVFLLRVFFADRHRTYAAPSARGLGHRIAESIFEKKHIIFLRERMGPDFVYKP